MRIAQGPQQPATVPGATMVTVQFRGELGKLAPSGSSMNNQVRPVDITVHTQQSVGQAIVHAVANNPAISFLLAGGAVARDVMVTDLL